MQVAGNLNHTIIQTVLNSSRENKCQSTEILDKTISKTIKFLIFIFFAQGRVLVSLKSAVVMSLDHDVGLSSIQWRESNRQGRSSVGVA